MLVSSFSYLNYGVNVEYGFAPNMDIFTRLKFFFSISFSTNVFSGFLEDHVVISMFREELDSGKRCW